jgi:hypothetical protein
MKKVLNKKGFTLIELDRCYRYHRYFGSYTDSGYY